MQLSFVFEATKCESRCGAAGFMKHIFTLIIEDINT